MNDKIKICFVCTENIGRSLAAEHCLKIYLKNHGITGIEVISAGTSGIENNVSDHCFTHFDELRGLGADLSKHKRTALTQKVIDECDLIVAMAKGHQRWIKEKFGIDVPLFSELANGSKKSIRIPAPDSPECPPFLRKMVKDFYTSMPVFLSNVRQRLNKIE